MTTKYEWTTSDQHVLPMQLTIGSISYTNPVTHFMLLPIILFCIMFLCTFWFPPQLYWSLAWLSSWCLDYYWYNKYLSPVLIQLTVKDGTTRRHDSMFEIINYYKWLSCSKTCYSMQLTREAYKTKNKSANYRKHSESWQLGNRYNWVIRALEVQGPTSIPRDSTLTFTSF